MTIEEAIEFVEYAQDGVQGEVEVLEFYKLVEHVLREQEERENPEPLTIEDLRKVDGEPVWTSRYGWRICYGTTKVFGGERMVSCHGTTIDLCDYGINWLAYKSKPKED